MPRKKRMNNPNAMIKITEYTDMNDYMRQYNREYTRLQTRLRREANPKPVLTEEELKAKAEARKQKVREYYKNLRSNIETRKKLNRQQAECKKLNPQYRIKGRVYKQARRYKQRLVVLSHYGVGGEPICRGCGFDDVRALAIDHINNDGAAHRKVVAGGKLYQWLGKNDFPEGFQTLCHNCNHLKQYELHATKTLADIEKELGDEETRIAEATIPFVVPALPEPPWAPPPVLASETTPNTRLSELLWP